MATKKTSKGGQRTSKAKAKSGKPKGTPSRTFDARPDTRDFRDLMFVPTLVEVPTTIPLDDYIAYEVPVLDQGHEGACTGFGLATVANYLLVRRRIVSDRNPVSPRMFYELARRYDEWPGENYEGSSARGAMKGWHRHGVCAEEDYPRKLEPGQFGGLNEARTSAALKRPLGAYFRVNHHDLVAMHTALAEVGVLYATATVHAGWSNVGADGIVEQSDEILGGHAFAIVAYDGEGFWIQNSWGPTWGRGGMCRVSYDDWLANGTDVWVARLGAPVTLRSVASTARIHAPTSGQSASYSYADLRPHLVSLGNDGELKPGGPYGTTREELRQIIQDDIPRVMKDWKKKRIVLYAHGGLVAADAAVQRISEYRPMMLDAEVYPLAFIWHSDWWTTIANILQDATRRRRPEGVLDSTKDFLLDRLDDALEPLARALTGRASWREMQENALAASRKGHGAALVVEQLATLAKSTPGLEIHLIGHSAGSILLAPVVAAINAAGLKVDTCTLWAPACTMALFRERYQPAIDSGGIGHFTLFTLGDKAEQDDSCAQLYHKSLLYLVSNALEDQLRIPLLRDGVPLLGMQSFVVKEKALMRLFEKGHATWVVAPNQEPEGSPLASGARHHGDFDDDKASVQATLAGILGDSKPAALARGAALASATSFDAVSAGPAAAPDVLRFAPSEGSLRARRRAIDLQTRTLLR